MAMQNIPSRSEIDPLQQATALVERYGLTMEDGS